MNNLEYRADFTWGCSTIYKKIPAPGSGGLTEEEQQRRIRASIMRRWIRHSFDKASLKTLDLIKRKFQYKHVTKKTIEEDGPTMDKIIFDRINPSTRVGVSNLVAELSNFTLKDYDQNIVAMSDAFEQTYNDILLKGGTFSNL